MAAGAVQPALSGYRCAVIHHGTQPVLIPKWISAGLPAHSVPRSAVIHSLDDLSTLHHWIDAGAQGTFAAD
jgi:hypothetical protein